MTINFGKRYTLEEQLGAGGMGVVYRAVDRLNGQRVALKRVTEALGSGDDPAALRLALATEFRVLAALHHPNIIRVIDYGFDETGQPFYTMDLLENARTILDAGWRLDYGQRVDYLIQALQALAYLHRWGILHRDLKPENVLVVDDQVKLLDFGLALSRDQGRADHVTGTLAYMAPEVMLGSPPTEAADLYAIGVMGYELYAGHSPFASTSVDSLVQHILTAVPDFSRLDLSEAMIGILRRLLAKAPEDRPESAGSVMSALAAASGRRGFTQSLAVRESFLQAARFVGRETEREQLIAALETALQGQGSGWLVGGESGVGKSRLLDELRTVALVRGFNVLRGQAISEGGMPYILWHEVLRRLLLLVDVTDLEAGVIKGVVTDVEKLLGRDVPDALSVEPSQAQTRLLGVLSGVLRRVDQPMLIILEDLQWAGTESLTMLGYIAQIITELPILLVGSYRDDERPDLPDRLLHLNRIHLDRLREAEIAELSESLLGPPGKNDPLVDLLHQETEGNVFFLIEVVRALAEDAGDLERVGQMTLPPGAFAGGVQQIVMRRLARVPDEWRAALEMAAVFGRRIDIPAMRRAMPDLDVGAWLTACANAAVFDAQEEYWRFAHDKLREGILAALDDAELRQLHHRVAQVLEQLYPGERVTDLALHWDIAGDVEQALYYMGLAGNQALEASAYDEAIRYFERALRLLPDPESDRSRERRALLLRGLASAYWGLSDYQQAQQLFTASLEICRDLGDSPGEAEALKGLGDCERRIGNHAAARAHFATSLEHCRRAGNTIATGQALARLGLVARNLGDLAAARHYYYEALGYFERAGAQARLATVLSGLGLIASDMGDNDSARAYLARSLAIAREVHNPTGTALVLTALAWINYISGNYADAQRFSLESLALSRQVGDRWMTANNLGNLGKITAAGGDLDTAMVYMRQALDIASAISVVPLMLEILPGVAYVWHRRAEPGRAAELLGLALRHPASYNEVALQAEPLLAALRIDLGAAALEAALEQGAAADLETVTAGIIADD